MIIKTIERWRVMSYKDALMMLNLMFWYPYKLYSFLFLLFLIF